MLCSQKVEQKEEGKEIQERFAPCWLAQLPSSPSDQTIGCMSSYHDINTMHETLRRLCRSINDLEKAVQTARITLSKKPACPRTTFDRLDVYLTIIEKQRDIIPDIVRLMQSDPKDELFMAIRRVNALSEMVRDDARDLLAEISSSPVKPERPDPH